MANFKKIYIMKKFIIILNLLIPFLSVSQQKIIWFGMLKLGMDITVISELNPKNDTIKFEEVVIENAVKRIALESVIIEDFKPIKRRISKKIDGPINDSKILE